MLDEVDDFAFLVVADDDVDAVDFRHLFAPQLCITARNNDNGVGVFLCNLANLLAALLVGKFGDRTGIDYANVGVLVSRCRAYALLCQEFTDGRRLGKVKFAPKRDKLGCKISEYGVVYHTVGVTV